MHRRLLASTVAFLAATAPLTGQSDCADQFYVPTPNNGLEVTDNQSVTQTFTVGLLGQLTRVELVGINHHRGTSVHNIDVAIVTTDASGVPTTTTLATTTVPPSAVPPTRGNVLIDLSAANLIVTPGQVLGLRLQTASPSGGATYGWSADAITGTYDGGSTFIRGNVGIPWDMGFRTYVAFPAAWSNYGAGHPGTNGVPALSPSANPVIGVTINLLVGNSLGAQTQAALAIGVQDLGLPFLGGTLLVLPLVAPPVSIPAAGAQLPLGIPLDGDLCGVPVFVQVLLLDGGASQGVAFTRGLRLDLGL
jgi:hypothetical protein